MSHGRSGDPTIVVVGTAVMDLASHVRRIPDRAETVVADDLTESFGGKGANQAVMAGSLGARTYLIGGVGVDRFGDDTLENLRSHAVHVDYVRRDATRATGMATIWVESSGENRIVIALGANLAVTSASVSQSLQVVDNVDAVLCQFELSQDIAEAALRAGRARGALTILNPAPYERIGDAVMAEATWLVLNEPEFDQLSGDVADVAAARGELIERARLVASGLRKDLVVTLGSRGAIVARAEREPVTVDTPTVAAIDTVGAGDAFVGSFAYGLTRGMAPTASASFACACAASSVERRGTQASYPAGTRLEALRAEHDVP